MRWGRVGRWGRPRGLALFAAVVALASVAPEALVAQTEPEERVDSTEIRIRERLRRLARPPGYDSILFVQDSVAREEARTGRGALGFAGDSALIQLSRMPGFSLTLTHSATKRIGKSTWIIA